MPKITPDEKIIRPVFINNWGNFGAPWNIAGYWKDENDVVHLEGIVACAVGAPGGSGTVAFNLPPGYAPTLGTVRLSTSGQSGITPNHVFVDIATTGTVTITVNGAAANGAVVNANLNGSFRIT